MLAAGVAQDRYRYPPLAARGDRRIKADIGAIGVFEQIAEVTDRRWSSRGPGQPLPPALDRAVLQQRIDTLRILAENTDGIALANSNDLDKQMRRLAADLTSYYLIGSCSTNAKLDGGFRTIKVKVSRPRVEVRARHGYRAASAAELAAAREAAATVVPPEKAALSAELGLLSREGRSQPSTSASTAARADAREADYRRTDYLPSRSVNWQRPAAVHRA